jgi:hypothetical protein
MTAALLPSPAMARFVLHTLTGGAAELRTALPLHVSVLRQLPGHDGRPCWHTRLDRPLTYQPPAGEHRPGTDTLWIRDLVITTSHPDSALHHGMRDLAVDVAAVIDARLERDTILDPDKVAYLGTGLVDDLTTETPAPRHPARAEPPAESAADTFRNDLHTWVARLASMAGEQPDAVPRETATGHGYTLGPAELTYRGTHSDGSPRTQTTTDHRDLLFWILDDLARELATHWTLRAPAFSGDDDHARSLLQQRWHNLMAALSRDWGARTRARIDDLPRVTQLSAPQPEPAPVGLRDPHTP